MFSSQGEGIQPGGGSSLFFSASPRPPPLQAGRGPDHGPGFDSIISIREMIISILGMII